MFDQTSSLKMLAGTTPTAVDHYAVPIPRRRWKTRVLLPLMIGVAGLALLAYSARGTFRPAVEVRVLPVIAKPASAFEPSTTSLNNVAAPTQAATVLTQAPGWVEPDPYPITIPALAEGVIEKVLIVEGQRVESGQVVVKMIDEDARLAAAASAAELKVEKAALQEAKAKLEFQKINYERIRQLYESQNAPDIEWADAKKQYEEAQAQVNSFKARVERHETMCEQAQLTLSRMEIRSPATGIVMARLVEPGTRISMSDNTAGHRMGAVARLYDPQHLQVRVDVPLADAAKVQVGTRAEIVTEATSDHVFHGMVTRLVHEADIQRNTIQVKVAIAEPSPTLKPEMLARVRFFSGDEQVQSARSSGQPSVDSSGPVWAPQVGFMNVEEEKADVWIVENDRTGPIAAQRQLQILGTPRDGYSPVSGNLKPGARVIIKPPADLKAGDRVKVIGEYDGGEGER